MPRLFQRLLFGGASLLLLAASAGAQWRPFGGPPYPSSRFPGGFNPVDRTLSDLDRAWSRSSVDRHERGHFANAQRDLIRFQDRWARGHFDTGRLDSAIENIHHLVNSDQVRPLDRQLLSRDLYDMRAFRSRRGYSRGWYPY